jgi:hypothetical protein
MPPYPSEVRIVAFHVPDEIMNVGDFGVADATAILFHTVLLSHQLP